MLRLEAVHPGAGAASSATNFDSSWCRWGCRWVFRPRVSRKRRRALATNAAAGGGGDEGRGGRSSISSIRILGLPVRGQNLLFGYFTEVLGAEVKARPNRRKYSEG